MDKPTTIAWIFLAVELASQREPANRKSISTLADGINHAVPTNKEMDFSLRWLEQAELVVKKQSRYVVSETGKKVLAAIPNDVNTVLAVWERLTNLIAAKYDQTESFSSS